MSAITNNGSNETPAIVKTELDVDGQRVEVLKQGEDLTIAIPDGLEGEALEKFKQRAQDAASLMGRTNKDRYDLLREKEELERARLEREREFEEREAKLKAERERLEQMKAQTTSPANNYEERLMKELKVDSIEELEDYASDHPVAFSKASAKVNTSITREMLKANSESQMQNSRQSLAVEFLTRNIQNEGNNPAEVQAFAKYNGISDLEKAYELYKDIHSKGKSRTNKFNEIVRVQKNTVSFVPKSELSSANRKDIGSMSEAEIQALPPNDPDYLAYFANMG